MRQPDPITLQRVSKLLSAARPLLVEEITTAWLARTLVRVDGGPMLDATVADAVCAISRAVMEYHEGGLRAETKLTFGDLTGRLYSCGNTLLDICHSTMWPDIMARLYTVWVGCERSGTCRRAAIVCIRYFRAGS